MADSYSAPTQLFRPKLLIKAIVFVGPLAIIAIFTFVYVYFPGLYLLLVEEDGISEYMQAGAYLVASAIGVGTALLIRKSEERHIYWLLIMFALGTLFMGFEEINWGQRIIGFRTPDFIEEVNTQSELSVHNIRIVEERIIPKILIVVGLFGGLAWAFRKKPSKVSLIVIPDWYLSLYFLSVAAFNAYRWYINPDLHYVIHQEIGFWRHQELFELLLALGFLFVAVSNYRKLAYRQAL
jgi:hypothetical protein